MFISLDVLRNLPGHEERQDTCIKYRSTLLDALRPNIQQELNTMNIVALQEYLYVFRRLNCEEEFNKLYITLRPARIKEQWQSGSSDNKEYFSENVALYLGNLVRSVAEEETNITDLFGVDSVAKFSHSVLLQALEPMDTLLLESLQRLGDVHLAFETYTVLEEFSRRTIATLDTKDAKLKVAVMDAAFVGFWRFTTGYFEAEERMAKRSLYAMMDRISLLQQSDGNSGNELDPIEQLTRVAEQCQGELRGLLEETLRPLMQREARLFGGIFIRSSVRSIATLLQTCCKLLTLKVGNLALALGFPDFSQPLLGSSSGGALEPYSSFQDENAAAIKLAERISSSEVSRQGAVSTALHVYRAVLSFESLVDEVENLVSNSCSDIQRMVLSTFSTSAVLLDSAHPFGAIYGLYRIQNDEALSAEVKNFLNTATIATATNTRFQGMYSLVRSTSQRLTTRAREIILALSVSTPERGLAGYASEECWNRVVDADRLSEIQSNMLPLAVITAAGEHLLSLVQDLEGFAASASESGTISREDLLGLVVGSSGWRRAREILAAATDSKALSHLIDRVQVAKLIVVMEKEAIQHGGQGLIPRRTAEDINIEASAMVEGSFVNDWLIVIADAILGMIVAQLLQIRSLSLFGRAQLAIDIDYFVNVINATGIKPHPLQHHIKQLVSVGRQAEGDKAQSIRWKRVLSAMGQGKALPYLLEYTSETAFF